MDYADRDAKWFKRRPHRDRRVRLTECEELEELRSAAPHVLDKANPLGFPYYTIVSQIRPGFRVRRFFWSDQDYTNLPDKEIAALERHLSFLEEMNERGALH